MNKIKRELSIDIFYSELNDGYMYNVYDTTNSHQKDTRDSLAGGLCTGTIKEALEMACDSVMELLSNKTIYKCPHCGGRVCKSETEGYHSQCLKCDEDFYKHELI